MSVAIVVPAIAVDPLTERCVVECARLYPGVEIIVVVDDAERRAAIEPHARVIETGPITIGAKRNRAAALTSADHLAFIDSDAYPAPGWIEHATELLDADPAVTAVGGPNVSPPDQPAQQRWVGRAHDSLLVAGWWRFRRDPTAHARDVDALPSCNLVVRRRDYLTLDGMNEDLFTAEDTDFCRRLVAAGGRIRFSPAVLVFHKDRDLRGFAVQRFTFGVAMIPLLRHGRAPNAAYTAASAALAGFAAFVAAGPVVAVVGPPRWRRCWAVVLAAYVGAIGFEAIRLADRRSDTPGTALALVIGNLGPGYGALLEALGLVGDLRGVYRNDR